MVKKNKIPDGWKDYTDVGERIPGTPFLPFKVPLKQEVCQRLLNEAEWFTPSILLQKEPNIKLIIDLTMAQKDRYYFTQDFTSNGVWIRNVKCEGGGRQVPARHLVQKFQRIVDEFLTSLDASDNDAVIGVHCTHGLNRTGYFICKYMVDRLNMSPDQAINAFEVARGHKFRRELYVNDLLRKNSVENWRVGSGNDQSYHRDDQSYHRRNWKWNRNNYTRYYPPSTSNGPRNCTRKKRNQDSEY